MDQPTGGQLDVNLDTAKTGETVTVSPVAGEGYELISITVTDQDGRDVPVTDNGDGTFSFQMPEGGAIVRASFQKVQETQEPEAPAARFQDVDPEKWYWEAVNYVVNKDLMRGVSDEEFRPNTPLSRAMVVTILHRLEGEPAADSGKDFTDVKPGKWYSEAVAWGSAAGVVEGFQDDSFRPDEPVTREQLATLLYRYAQSKGGVQDGETSPLTFSDTDKLSDWAEEAMGWCVTEGLIEGKDDDRLDPKGTATRAQFAAILMRYLERAE